MAEEIEKNKTFEEDKEFEGLVKRESYLMKFMKSGLVALGVATVAKKSRGTNVEKWFDDDMVKAGAIVGGSLVLSGDDDKGGNLLAASSFIYGGYKFKSIRNDIHSNIDTFAKWKGHFDKADEYRKTLSLISMNFGDKVKESLVSNFVTSLNKEVINDETTSRAKKGFAYASAGLKTIFKTSLEPMKAIKEHGLKEGLKYNLRASYSTSDYLKYKMQSTQMGETSFFDIMDHVDKEVNRMGLGVDFYDQKPGVMREILEGVGKNLGMEGLFLDSSGKVDLTFMNKAKKFNKIEGETTFSSMMGVFSRYDETTKTVVADMKKILSGDSNNLNFIQDLAKKFEEEAVTKVKGYRKFSDEAKEVLFVDYLKNNGFEDFVSKNYKNEKHIAISEFGDKINNKYIATKSELDADEEKINKALLGGLIKEEDAISKMELIQKRRDNLIDEDTLDIISDFKVKGLALKVENDYDNSHITGFKNYNLIKNFSLTEAIEKSEKGIVDKTSLDSSIAFWSMAGIVEKSLIGMYKNPLNIRELNVWNPLKLVESDRRINDVIFNEHVKNIKADNGFLTNGKFVQWSKDTHFDEPKKVKTKNGWITVQNEKKTFNFFSKEGNSHKITSLKQDIDLLDENYLVRSEDAKIDMTYKQIYTTLRKHGIKSAVQDFSQSHANPTSLRYRKGSGFRLVDARETYFSDDPVLAGIHDKNLTDNALLGFLERKGKKNRVASLVLGKKGDINSRMLRIDNRSVEERAKFGIKLLLEENYNQYTKMAVTLKGTVLEGQEINGSFGHKFANTMLSSLSETMFDFNDPEFIKGMSANEMQSVRWFTEQFKSNGSAENITKVLKINDGTFKAVLSNGTEFDYTNSWTRKVDNIDLLRSRISNAINIKQGNWDSLAGNSKNYNAYVNDMADWLYMNRFNKDKAMIGMSVNELVKNTTDYLNEGLANKRYVEMARSKGVDLNYDFLSDGTQGGTSKITMVNSFIHDVYESQTRSIEAINKNMYGDVISRHSPLNQLKKRDYSKLGESMKGLEDTYEASLGFEYNRLLAENKGGINDYFNDYYKFSKNVGNEAIDGATYRFFNYASDLDRYYGIGGLEKGIESITKKDFDNFKSYGYFKELQKDSDFVLSGIEEKDNEEHGKNLFETVETVRNYFYETRESGVSSKLVIEDTMKKHMEISNIMDSVREFVESMIRKSNSGFRGANSSSSDSSFMFGDNITTGDIFMRNTLDRLQDTLQFVGVERIPGDSLGNHWTTQYKNFMKYRFVPLAVGVTGYMAADSLSDALVPDDVPIFGNGITGVATRGFAGARVGIQYGLKYTGMLGLMQAVENAVPGLIDNGLSHILNPLMDPSEMIDVYFHGKAVRTNKNRNWFTAGRQSGDGEEFDQYRPHVLYTLGNRTSGIYDNKFEKFFRHDNLLTKYPWYILDPYKEERDAYEKFGALYPMTEQLFKDVPVFGHLMNATLGEIIKPTQYVGESQWKVADGVMKNINYDPNDPSSPEFINYVEPNKFIRSAFEAFEDLKTWSGLMGYSITKATEMAFGATNPYADKVTLDSIDNDTSYYAKYERLGLGGMFGTTEGIRRLLDDGDALGMIEMNPLKQKLPDWMPGYFSNGRNPYMKWNAGEYVLPGKAFERTSNSTGDEELDKFKILAMTAPGSQDFRKLKESISNRKKDFNKDQTKSYLQSIAYAENYGKREYMNNVDYVSDTKKISLKIDEKISPYEFISGGKRYKIDSVESDFNKLSSKIGERKALNLMTDFNNSFEEKSIYEFKVANSQLAVGIDNQGDFIKITSDKINSKIKGESIYNHNSGAIKTLLTPLRVAMRRIKNSAMPSHVEKIFGKKSAYNEWSQESVQAPYFRDWDSPISSFVEPFYNYSANNLASSVMFNKYATDAFMNSGATTNLLGLASMAGTATLPTNKIFGRVSKSSLYEDEEKVQNELEKVKLLAGDKSFYNMTGKERLGQYSKMLQESDSAFFEGLVNTENQAERDKILNEGSEILTDVLKTIWNRHQELIDGSNSDKMYEIEKKKIDSVIDIGYYDGNADRARAILKAKLGVKHSKLDNKRIGIIKSYRGGISKAEGEYIRNKMYQTYNSNAKVTSTIYPKGQININRRDD